VTASRRWEDRAREALLALDDAARAVVKVCGGPNGPKQVEALRALRAALGEAGEVDPKLQQAIDYGEVGATGAPEAGEGEA
jgi:hypothetical protein